MPSTAAVSALQTLTLGVDIGTSAVRVMAVTAEGHVAAAASMPLASSVHTGGHHEQEPAIWWDAVCFTLQYVAKQLGRLSDAVHGISVCGTSGTLVCAASDGTPLRPAIMYDDGRASREGAELNDLADSTQFGASFSLAKALWVLRHEPDIFDQTEYLLHPADWVIGRLTGYYGISDWGNSLKMGYDVESICWPAWLDRLPAIRSRLPFVVAPGTIIGVVDGVSGFPARLPVVAGTTDGVASCIASGLSKPGDFNVTLGTTLVFKAMSSVPLYDLFGRIYSHRLPGNLWLPGAASNTGCAWIADAFPSADLPAMDKAAEAVLPTSHIAYPLVVDGERFPFRCPEARGFVEPAAEGLELYAANLQGTACLERLGYDVLDSFAGCHGGSVFSAGGGSQSDVWMQLRADVSGRIIHRPACTEAAFGAATLAAAGTIADSPQDAFKSMARIDRTFTPERQRAYEEPFARFCSALELRGFFRPRPRQAP